MIGLVTMFISGYANTLMTHHMSHFRPEFVLGANAKL